MFLKDIYAVFVDGMFAGITEDEDEIWDIAQDEVNGFKKPLTDDDICDRVYYNTIRVNRWYVYNEHNCSDRMSNDNIMCYDYHETINCVEKMNALTIEKERAEAKIRAMTL